MNYLKPKGHTKITPKPFYNLWFGCGNRAFYQVKEDLHNIAERIGIEIQDGYITEKCDYEGDLEKIIIHSSVRSNSLLEAVASFYGVSMEDIGDLDIVLSIFDQ